LLLKLYVIDRSAQAAHLLNHRRWCHLANTLKDTANKRTGKKFHVWNSHYQHAAKLFETTPYYRLFLSNSWATCFVSIRSVCVAGQPVVQWMPLPATMPGVPAGLAYLTSVDQLLVHQLVEVLERK